MTLRAAKTGKKRPDGSTDKRQQIIRAAVRLFAGQGFDATTTLQIAMEANVTEPLIYYHFKNKDGLFTHILEKCFAAYFFRLDALPIYTDTEFEKIRNLIFQHFDIVGEIPEEIYILMSACPAKLRDPKGICAAKIEKQRQ